MVENSKRRKPYNYIDNRFGQPRKVYRHFVVSEILKLNIFNNVHRTPASRKEESVV